MSYPCHPAKVSESVEPCMCREEVDGREEIPAICLKR